jgi:hypothetical protein
VRLYKESGISRNKKCRYGFDSSMPKQNCNKSSFIVIDNEINNEIKNEINMPIKTNDMPLLVKKILFEMKKNDSVRNSPRTAEDVEGYLRRKMLSNKFVSFELRKRLRNAAKRINRRVIDSRGNKCENCGAIGVAFELLNSVKPEVYGSVLSVHHIVPIAFGGDNSCKNLMVLCKKCHTVADVKAFESYLPSQIKLEDIKNEDEIL